jgi:NAD(P)-dependent dehydrogenase (short-subunit alcohol dehydrogenase family)
LGIGAAIAGRLADGGWRVVVHSRTTREAGEQLAAELGGTYVAGDLRYEQQTRDLVDATEQRYGRLDLLVNNAGHSRRIPHRDLDAADLDEWRAALDVNLLAPWVLTTAAAPLLRGSPRPGGGCVVNVTSHAGVRPKGASIPYAASKAALNHVTRLLAVALAPAIRVNAVAPGLVDTPLTADWTDARQLWRERAPLGRGATPDEVAQLVCAIADSSYLTGEVVLLDGGMNLT